MARRRQPPTMPPMDISIEHGGKTYTGSYRCEKSGITVSYGGRSKRVHRDGMSDDTLTRTVADLVLESEH